MNGRTGQTRKELGKQGHEVITTCSSETVLASIREHKAQTE